MRRRTKVLRWPYIRLTEYPECTTSRTGGHFSGPFSRCSINSFCCFLKSNTKVTKEMISDGSYERVSSKNVSEEPGGSGVRLVLESCGTKGVTATPDPAQPQPPRGDIKNIMYEKTVKA